MAQEAGGLLGDLKRSLVSVTGGLAFLLEKPGKEVRPKKTRSTAGWIGNRGKNFRTTLSNDAVFYQATERRFARTMAMKKKGLDQAGERVERRTFFVRKQRTGAQTTINSRVRALRAEEMKVNALRINRAYLFRTRSRVVLGSGPRDLEIVDRMRKGRETEGGRDEGRNKWSLEQKRPVQPLERSTAARR